MIYSASPTSSSPVNANANGNANASSTVNSNQSIGSTGSVNSTAVNSPVTPVKRTRERTLSLYSAHPSPTQHE